MFEIISLEKTLFRILSQIHKCLQIIHIREFLFPFLYKIIEVQTLSNILLVPFTVSNFKCIPLNTKYSELLDKLSFILFFI